MAAILTARSLKIVAMLDPAELAKLAVRDAQARTILRIQAEGRTVTADIATKSLRKALTTIREAGAQGCAVFIQGKLAGDAVVEAGLIAQPKTPKPVAAAA